MAQVNLQCHAANPAIKHALTRRYVARFIVNSILSAAGLVSFVLTGPIMCRIAALDPALEGAYLALVVGWFWSLCRMWSLTFEARNRRKPTSTPKQVPQKGEI
jgi:hypothetical protein